MIILEVIPAFRIGGAEMMIKDLALELNKNNEVVIITFEKVDSFLEKAIINSRIKWFCLNKKKGFDFKLLFKLRKIIKQINPDVIHTHLTSFEYVYLASLFSKYPIYHTVHNLAEKEVNGSRFVLRRKFYKSNRVCFVAISNKVKESIFSKYKTKKSIPLIYNGIQLDKLSLKKNYKISEKFKIILIGRLVEQKNHKSLIEISKLLSKENVDHEIDIYGDGPLFNELQTMIKENGVPINLEGEVKDVYLKISNYDLFLMTSLWEGMSITLIEAMGSSMPIVATDVGGNLEMLDDGCGEISSIDTKDIYNKIIKVYNFSDEERKLVGLKANARSKNLFSSEEMAKQYLRLFNGEN